MAIDFNDPAIIRQEEVAKTAIAQIANQPSLRPYVDFLETLRKSELDDLMDVSIDQTPCEAARIQGSAKVYNFLIFMFKKARE